MLLLFSLFFSLNLIPPFITEWDNSIGKWHSFGDTTTKDDQIILIPKVQSTSGSLWTDAKLPITNWSVTFNITINIPEKIGGFAIWYIDEMSVLGPYYGGPAHFSGIVLLGTISKDDNDDKTYLDVQLLQSDDDSFDWISATLPKPDGNMWLFDDTTTFSLTIELIEKNVSIYASSDREITKLKSEIIHDNLDHNYLGITAMNDKYATNININQITFEPTNKADNLTAEFSLSRTLSSLNSNTSYPFFRKKSVYRNPEFKIASLDREILEKVHGDVAYFVNTNSSDAFRMILSCSDVSQKLATYKDLDGLIDEYFNTFSQKWAKRRTKMSINVKNMNHTLSSTLNQAQALIHIFKGTIHEALVHSKKKAVHFGEILEEMNQTELLSLAEASISNTSLISFLIYTSIAEVILAFLLFYHSAHEHKKYHGQIYDKL